MEGLSYRRQKAAGTEARGHVRPLLNRKKKERSKIEPKDTQQYDRNKSDLLTEGQHFGGRPIRTRHRTS